MSKRELIGLRILCLLVLIVGLALFVSYQFHSPTVRYLGTVVFSDDERYCEFVCYLSQPNVSIQSAEVFGYSIADCTKLKTSEPAPAIWVKYNVVIPRNISFPYPYNDAVPGGYTDLVYFPIMIVGAAGSATLFVGVKAKEQ